MTKAESPRRALSEEELKRVLARAAAIDVEQSLSTAATDVESIAWEAGISAAAVQRALAELHSPEAGAQAPTRPPGPWQRVRDLVSNLIAKLRSAEHALVGGVLAGALTEPGSAEGTAAIVGVGVVAVVSLVLAFRQRSNGSWLRLQFELAQLWCGFGVGLYLGGTAIQSEPARMLSVYWLVTAIIGGLISVPRPKSTHTPTDWRVELPSAFVQTSISRPVG